MKDKKKMTLVFLCTAQNIMGENVFTRSLTNNKFIRRVVEKSQ